MGAFFGLAVDKTGSVWILGANENGELGLGDTESRDSPCIMQALRGRQVAKVACGANFSMALGTTFGKQ